MLLNFSNNIEAKITECRLINEEGIVFSILLVKRAKLRANDRSSGCLPTADAIEKFIKES